MSYFLIVIVIFTFAYVAYKLDEERIELRNRVEKLEKVLGVKNESSN
jgi:hypothetical protein